MKVALAAFIFFGQALSTDVVVTNNESVFLNAGLPHHRGCVDMAFAKTFHESNCMNINGESEDILAIHFDLCDTGKNEASVECSAILNGSTTKLSGNCHELRDRCFENLSENIGTKKVALAQTLHLKDDSSCQVQ